MPEDKLLKTFNGLKRLFKKYESSLKVKTNYQTKYELVFDKPVTTKSKKTGNIIKKDELYFSALVVQSNYVGFYFMPIYSHRSEFKDLSPEILKLLKGKSCFHIKEFNDLDIGELEELVERGFNIYQKL